MKKPRKKRWWQPDILMQNIRFGALDPPMTKVKPWKHLPATLFIDNSGSNPTFQHGNSFSVTDITMFKPDQREVRDWTVTRLVTTRCLSS